MGDSQIENKYFKNAKAKAAEMLGNKEKINYLLKVAKDKLSDVNNTKLAENIKVLARMVKYYANGSYRAISSKSIIAIIAAVIYFAMPIDLIPDFIPITGFVDDFAVVMWVYNHLQKEVDAFKEWEASTNEST